MELQSGGRPVLLAAAGLLVHVPGARGLVYAAHRPVRTPRQHAAVRGGGLHRQLHQLAAIHPVGAGVSCPCCLLVYFLFLCTNTSSFVRPLPAQWLVNPLVLGGVILLLAMIIFLTGKRTQRYRARLSDTREALEGHLVEMRKRRAEVEA